MGNLTGENSFHGRVFAEVRACFAIFVVSSCFLHHGLSLLGLVIPTRQPSFQNGPTVFCDELSTTLYDSSS